MLATGFWMLWALRMRVSMSAMGSLMLISVYSYRRLGLPAGLDHARDVALEGELADLVARQAELAERAPRAARQVAAVAQARRVRVARQLLQLEAREVALLVAALGVVDDGGELFALLGVLGDERLALGFTLDERDLGHGIEPSVLEREAEGGQERLALV